ncbi:MAG: phosphoribosyl-AMP cyclohydrolase [Betaproteobacteria bacterium]|nr:phosphoribosyl-AMP cyclohydrolase [Betaproteobacteria bacterium]
MNHNPKLPDADPTPDATTKPAPENLSASSDTLLAQLQFNSQGLLPAIAQDYRSGRVLMMAWMNEQSLRESLSSGYACYWSRSRNRLWRKGEASGHRQKLHRLQLDCDGDALLLQVEQQGVACHTGRLSCFFYQWEADRWQIVEDVMIDPETVYR